MTKENLIEKINMNKKDLLDFETEIIELYEAGKIHSPIHLSGGNEDQLIEIFKEIKSRISEISELTRTYPLEIDGEWGYIITFNGFDISGKPGTLILLFEEADDVAAVGELKINLRIIPQVKYWGGLEKLKLSEFLDMHSDHN